MSATVRTQSATVFSSCEVHPDLDTLALRLPGGAYRVAPCPACTGECDLDLGDGHVEHLSSSHLGPAGEMRWDDASDCA